MRAVIQRVSNASVTIEKEIAGQIDRGILIYLGIGKNDSTKDVSYLAEKIVNLRIFEDNNGKMNISVLDKGYGILIISQFTLFADTRKGRRPSYNDSAAPEVAEMLYNEFIEKIRNYKLIVETGSFGANMDVRYSNNGPVTILLDSEKQF